MNAPSDCPEWLVPFVESLKADAEEEIVKAADAIEQSRAIGRFAMVREIEAELEVRAAAEEDDARKANEALFGAQRTS